MMRSIRSTQRLREQGKGLSLEKNYPIVDFRSGSPYFSVVDGSVWDKTTWNRKPAFDSFSHQWRSKSSKCFFFSNFMIWFPPLHLVILFHHLCFQVSNAMRNIHGSLYRNWSLNHIIILIPFSQHVFTQSSGCGRRRTEGGIGREGCDFRF